jgi:hypothetical protein
VRISYRGVPDDGSVTGSDDDTDQAAARDRRATESEDGTYKG